jgi:hypothetical protein
LLFLSPLIWAVKVVPILGHDPVKQTNHLLSYA